ncbi:YtnP family quorum-quenching lactonase [Desertibacillus haloalkaliphilus]|uniref:YtnP family quorum-quenching lactonase n=1 Tax=Desertibacillus haloalkaliphilus TaxID=1328930 RepID=UPI001C277BF7|nr:MBL fold metallo-hydrolase [Desertibacillus haloalkaliphilus]MBU8905246.1 MBL fold metallo-hydrolase [Desertibacillus haloalkaliphilus]
METVTIGDLKITWLNGGVTHMDGGAMFGVVPKPLWSKKYPHNENNQIELRTDPLLIQCDGKNILIEAGIGNGRFTDKQKRNYGIQEESFVEEELQQLGLTTADIDLVLMTHLHFDHATGLAKFDGDMLVPTFENATIYVSDIEWEEMRNPNIRSRNTYWEQNWKPIESKVKTFTGELEVVPGVRMIHTGGHSDGHSIIVIERDGEMLIHMADIMPTHAHNNVLWVLAYDDYPMDSIEAKQKWMDVGLNNQAWFIFYHDYKYRALKWNERGEVIEEVERKQRVYAD